MSPLEPKLTFDLERNPALTVVATYERTIGASLERVWENVLDWEHLPWLHGKAFADITCQAAGPWGWRAEVVYVGGTARSHLELLIDHANGRYVTRVLDGAGSGGEIWTTLTKETAQETVIGVEFCQALEPDQDADAMGAGYVALYSRLWDEDEQMMQARQRELDRRRTRDDETQTRIELGHRDALLPRLPLDVEAFGSRLRVYADEGGLKLHGLVCPHLLGPLEADGDALICPWHGYRFSRETGHSCDGKRLWIANPARIAIEDDRVFLLRESGGSRLD